MAAISAVDAPVGKDDQAGSCRDGRARLLEERLESSLHARCPFGGHEKHGKSDRGEPAPALELLEPGHLVVIDDRQIQRDLAARVGRGLQQVALAPGPREDRRHQLLADRVQRGIRHLGEELLEVIEQRLRAVGEHGQGRIVAHRADRFLAVCPHRAQDELEVFQGVAERLLALEQRSRIGPRNVRRRRQVGQRYHELAEPLAVGPGRGDLVLELFVIDDPALLQVDQEHLARFQPALLRRRSPARSRAHPPPTP